ncbi:hypothetical protein [Streptomyces sp. NPDC045470]|uniref:hypothetical protein n=1 Tax=Streptomyces sp. NPDC045470 TaxID=3155469 RepID=UPI0033C22C34
MGNTDTGTDAVAVINAYFAERLEKARAEAEKANAKLAQAQEDAAAFTERQELPPAVGAMKQGWALASWVTERATCIASDEINGKVRRGQYQQAKAERAAVLAWLEGNGYEVPGPFKD